MVIYLQRRVRAPDGHSALQKGKMKAALGFKSSPKNETPEWARSCMGPTGDPALVHSPALVTHDAQEHPLERDRISWLTPPSTHINHTPQSQTDQSPPTNRDVVAPCQESLLPTRPLLLPAPLPRPRHCEAAKAAGPRRGDRAGAPRRNRGRPLRALWTLPLHAVPRLQLTPPHALIQHAPEQLAAVACAGGRAYGGRGGGEFRINRRVWWLFCLQFLCPFASTTITP